jgi:hypothetical protein
MTRATFRSDFKLLVNSVLRRWNTSAMESALDAAAYEAEYRALLTWDVTALALEPMAPRGEMPDRAEQVVAF